MLSLQFITHQTENYSYLESARMALEGGCKWIQLRMKEASPEEVEEVDGVHLGKKDMPIGEARQMLGEAFIIGGTANTFEDVKLHHAAGADYLGIGPFRFTTTKKNLSPVLGLEGYTSILAQMNEAGIRIPVVAIGGIVAEDIPAIMETGVNGIALSGAILQAPDPVEETKRILNI